LWWQRVVREREDVEGLDSAIICHPRTWEASGHVEHFSDPMVDCRACKKRFRADQLEDAGHCSAREGSSEHDFTDPRHFNLMLQTRIGASEDAASLAYLRAETCQPIFTDFKRVREAARQKIPFGVAQIGKAFRNEINPRNFTFRSREFEQAELEFFCHPSERERWFEHWLEERLRFHRDLGFDAERLRTRPHERDELAHYAKQAVDVEYRFPFGWQEIEGIHDRGDWDLSRHGEFSGKDLGVTDPETKEHFVPMVIETSVGVDRTCLAALCDAYAEETLEGGETRTVLRLHPALAPLKAAVLPLSRKLAEPARALHRELRRRWNVFYDDSGNIGRRYRRQDEVGTPFCVTYDFDSEQDGKVTVRERDGMTQERIALDAVATYLREHVGLEG
jgi:glycyl-tRNA synthetase